MDKRFVSLACVLALIAGGCATVSPPTASAPKAAAAAPPPSWTPTIDTRHVNQARYARDLGECRTLAASVPGSDGSKEAKKGALKGGLGMAAVIGVATVLTGGMAAVAALPAVAGSAALSVGGGALTAGYVGKNLADAKYRSALTDCLADRGYHVLG
ncbi:hypothetical protein [Phenylobacterium aquaticum]|uniref:hypothetical protein n=1 Tax=Phenylobacterium aquaticum TaxID=1763816 RepID=UPI001F5E0038|nr:hypothetical protein [Phenylobacterium aquaticum]MCI3133151.1 hypothetical protein [Phenylobacterium aquaticum]